MDWIIESYYWVMYCAVEYRIGFVTTLVMGFILGMSGTISIRLLGFHRTDAEWEERQPLWNVITITVIWLVYFLFILDRGVG